MEAIVLDMRVRFFSDTDLSCGRNLYKAQEILENLDDYYIIKDINDAIELYNTKLYIDSGIYLSSWTEEQKEKYISISKGTIPTKIGMFCSKISDKNIVEFIENLHYLYYDDFWKLIELYKVYEQISAETFKEIMELKKVSLRYILKNRSIVFNYDKELTEKIKSKCEYATLIVANYLEHHDEQWKPLFFPPSLTCDDKTSIINDYIGSEAPNPNIIELIYKSQSSKELPLPDSTIYEAYEKHKALVKSFFEENEGVRVPIEVVFSKEVDSVELDYKNGGIFGAYSLNWVTENLDYPTVLNNFIHLFGFVDSQFRCEMTGDKFNDGFLEIFFGIKGKREYPASFVYQMFDNFFLILTVQYDQILRKNNVNLLSVFKWFFEEYLNDEFDVCGFEFDIPSENTTYLEKCKLLATSIERALKQFTMFVNDGNINHEMLSISSNSLKYKDIPSLIKNKYIYKANNDLNYVFNSMFSNQSILLMDICKGDNYDLCYDFFKYENVKIDEFDMCHQLVEKLLENKFLVIDARGYIKPVDKRLNIIRDLFDNKVICMQYVRKYENELKEFFDKGQIYFEDTLFSIPEQQYLNYLFNRSEFSNGLDLRNKYVHGNHDSAKYVEKHKMNYYIFLRTLAFIIIKINEEFCHNQKDKM